VEKLRTYLATKRSGWARNRYIKIFIGAVRGEAAAFDTAVLASLILMLSLLMALWIWSSATEVERDRRSLQNKFDVLTALRRNEKIEITKDKVEALDAEVQREVPELIKRLEQDVFLRRIFSIADGLIFIWMLFIWFPYVIIRKQFEHELTRFTLRIQGLASKAELAELAVAEAQVTTEQSLRIFVEKAKAIAVRHEVPQLVSTFDLWSHKIK